MKKGEGEGSGAELIRARGAGVVMRRGPDSMNNSTQDETAILDEARRLPEGQRAPYLERTCGADAELRQRVASRLAALPRSRPAASGTAADNEATVDSSAAGGPPVPVLRAAEETPGCVVGRYKLLEMIGEGGFGCVYVAEQKEPVKRRVALKIIKLGMDTRQVVARFEAERQALAMMDHPNIAKVLDAGATDTGRPFFVMELVRGVRITDYCDENKLSTRKRLDLFILVCRAIEHAHQKGIIHRDIKPSNILVATENGAAVPKVIDFGIAKATSGRLTDKTVYTQADQFVGTPAYMSPEQAEASGLDIDTRSDIYSLGVLLYELLTAETPFESKNLLARGFDEMRRIIREIEPQLPSLRLRAKHDTGQTSAATLHRHRPQTHQPHARRPGLGGDEVPGKGPQPALRNCGQFGGRRAAVPGQRTSRRPLPQRSLPLPKAGAAQPPGFRRGGRNMDHARCRAGRDFLVCHQRETGTRPRRDRKQRGQ